MDTGEVARCLGRFGSARVSRAVLVSPIPPFHLQTRDNREGLPPEVSDGFIQAAKQDAPAWMKGFLDSFYNIDKLRSIDDELLTFRNTGIGALDTGPWPCADANIQSNPAALR
jgi:hypothetical protein